MNTRKKIRLSGYDYSNSGFYFITICSKERECIFAKINEPDVGAPLVCALMNVIELTHIGQIIEKQWNAIPNRFDSVSIDEFIIMPNHIHGILFIKSRAEASAAPTLGHVVRAFKSKCTIEYLQYIKNKNLDAIAKIWQRSFYDHVIRDDESLAKIRAYIRNNPSMWDVDKDNLANDMPLGKKGYTETFSQF